LHEIKEGEADKTIELLTPEYGKILVHCKGVCKHTSKNFALAQTFNYGDFIIDNSKAGYYLSEGNIIENFHSKINSMETMALKAYIVEVIKSTTHEGDNADEILRHTLNSLWVIAYSNLPQDLVKAGFELRLAVILGYMPNLECCDVCGQEHTDGYYFDIMGGVIRGKFCIKKDTFSLDVNDRREANIIVPISHKTLEIMRQVISLPHQKGYDFAKGEINDIVKQELKNACETYLLNQIERGFDTLNFYKKLTIV